ncbi:MAG: LptF/LptG family permease, partial [candidate division Zixibacteria bacterium]|nr:LptF/LptG family permease [candidate division Zixibacteria bacterium]NIX59003.1 LptF/LptG family permease [candidate division Zixibacteria bacterium]
MYRFNNLLNLACMGILSRYILREHIGPFIFALVITLFVLIIDLVPDIVELIIGKNLDALTVLWVFVLNLAWMLALAVPMACLIATLMAFGRLSSDMELLAIRTSGINMLRIIAPILIVSMILGGGLVWFNNEVLPDANHRARVLMSDIRVMRPTLSIQSNVFLTDIPGYFILLGDIDHETSRIRDVLIYDQRYSNVRRTITADRGYLEYLEGGQVLSFELEDGEIYESDVTDPTRYRRVLFKKQVFNIRDVSRELRKTSSEYRGDREMSTSEMLAETEDLRENIGNYRDEINKLILSHKDPNQVLRGETKTLREDRMDEIDAVKVSYVIDALNNMRNTMNILKNNYRKINQVQKSINVYLLEVHKKFSIPAACVVFVLIGAPLGMLSRRGGMGTAIGISVGLFIIYWAFLIGGEELSDRGITSPVMSMWAPNILIGAIGLLLLYQLITEKSVLQIINKFRNSRLGSRLSDWMERISKLLKGELEKKGDEPKSKAIWRKHIRPIKILDSYLLGKFMKAVILSLFVFVIIMHLVHLIEHLDTYIDKHASITDVLKYYLYTTPFIIVLTIPIATLLGAIFTIGLMARRNELLAIKASGVSLWRIALPLLIAGFIISVCVFIASEEILPYTNQQKQEIRYAKIEKQPQYKEEYYTNFHRRGDFGRIFNFRLYNPRQNLGKDVQIHTFDENRLLRLIKAKEFVWLDTVWVAVDGTQTIFSAAELPEKRDSIIEFDSLYLSSLTEKPERFTRRNIDPRDFGYDQTIADLKEEIEIREKNGISATPEKVYLRFKYSIPLTSFIIILIAVPLAADPKRGSPAIGFAFAIGISFTYMILFEVFRTLGTSGKLSPPLSAWSVNAIFFLVGLVMMFKAR